MLDSNRLQVLQNPYLRVVPGAEALPIDACDTETFFDAPYVFTGGIHRDFKEWGLHVPSTSRRQTKATVFEVVQSDTFPAVFEKFSVDLAHLSLTQAQIVNFLEKHRRWFGRGALFPLDGGESLIAATGSNSSGLEATVGRLKHIGGRLRVGRRIVVVW